MNPNPTPMGLPMNSFERREYKYFVPLQSLERLRQRFLRFMVHDPHCLGMDGCCYGVRSIYFDTPRFLFYREKLAGIRVRKKLRVRVYDPGNCEVSPAFLEIKYKVNGTVFKRRARMPQQQLAEMNSELRLDLLSPPEQQTERQALQKFAYYYWRYNLEPKVLVVYEREALVWPDDPTLRVTLDMNVRSYPNPHLEDIHRTADLNVLTGKYFILEVKSNRSLPFWAHSIIGDHRLRLQAISKYVHGVELWLPIWKRQGLL